MGPDQIHGVVRWISILCATKPSNLTLFGNMIIISQIAIEKNLKKFLSPHLKKPGSKKSAVTDQTVSLNIEAQPEPHGFFNSNESSFWVKLFCDLSY